MSQIMIMFVADHQFTIMAWTVLSSVSFSTIVAWTVVSSVKLFYHNSLYCLVIIKTFLPYRLVCPTVLSCSVYDIYVNMRQVFIMACIVCSYKLSASISAITVCIVFLDVISSPWQSRIWLDSFLSFTFNETKGIWRNGTMYSVIAWSKI